MENKLKKFISDAGKTTKKLLDTAVYAADQNDDGKFDLKDVSVIADSIGAAVKQGTQTLKENADEQVRLLELKTLQPIFIEALASSDFTMPKLVRITERDKRYTGSSVCQGSIGYLSNQKGLRIVNIFNDSLGAFNLKYYPNTDCEFYYVDPSKANMYIALDKYFDYLKIVRVNELQKIAQDLGAKYFKVTYKEEKSSLTAQKAKANAKASNVASVNAEHEHSASNYSKIEIAAEMNFPGKAPVKPKLHYLKDDHSINTLISMRMDKNTPLLNQKYMLKMSTSSGMKETDAVKIDAVLKGLKCAGNTTLVSEVQNEARRYLEYDIEF